jgi:hypothetical protein
MIKTDESEYFYPQKTQEEWLVAFYIAAVIYCLGAIFFLIFSDGEIQDWAKDEEEEDAIDSMVDKLPEVEETPEDDDVFKTE